jgi:Trypsin
MSIEKDGAPTRRLDPDEGHASDAGQRSDADARPERALPRATTILGVAVLALAVAWAAAYALGPEGKASASGATPDLQIEALTHMGISPERASQAIAVQSEVASTGLGSEITAALGDSFAGVWFQPAEARFYIGVTSAASRRTAEQVLAKSGMALGNVVIQQVRSTWLELVAAQEQWNKKHATLLKNMQASTGILTQNNAVRIELSSSIPAAERTALEHEAATATVNILIDVVPPANLNDTPKAKKTCSSGAFVKLIAYCEEAITAGVAIAIGSGQTQTKCTAGPMLISGNETYMLTAGHCFDETTPEGGSSITRPVKSKFPSGGGLREIGNEVTRYWNTERDMAVVKVKRPGEFSEALPIPVPAVMAEWGLANPVTPHAVNGQEKANTLGVGAMVCHEGRTSGEHCGVIKALNVRLNPETGPATEHLVETTTCADGGDSGGPYFFRTKAGEILMLGTEVGGAGNCQGITPFRTKFEPLIGLVGFTKFGILETFTGKLLLTTANESRP